MVSSGLLRRVALVRNEASEELSSSILRSVRRLLVTAKVPSSLIVVALMMEALSSSETSVITTGTRRNIRNTPFFTSIYVCPEISTAEV
jgi:hypothetical protein